MWGAPVVLEIVLFARRSGDDGHIHGGGPGMWIEQGEGGAAQGCAGRVGVVDKQDALARTSGRERNALLRLATRSASLRPT